MRRVPHPAKAIIVARGEKIKEAAAASGCNHHTFGRILNGDVTPSPALSKRLAEHLGVGESDLWRGEVAELIQRTRLDRGLPPTIEDPAVLAKVSRLIGEAGIAS